MTQLVKVGDKTLEEFMEEKLASDFPGWGVECGENWEMIATIFFNAGRYGEHEPEYDDEHLKTEDDNSALWLEDTK